MIYSWTEIYWVFIHILSQFVKPPSDTLFRHFNMFHLALSPSSLQNLGSFFHFLRIMFYFGDNSVRTFGVECWKYCCPERKGWMFNVSHRLQFQSNIGFLFSKSIQMMNGIMFWVQNETDSGIGQEFGRVDVEGTRCGENMFHLVVPRHLAPVVGPPGAEGAGELGLLPALVPEMAPEREAAPVPPRAFLTLEDWREARPPIYGTKRQPVIKRYFPFDSLARLYAPRRAFAIPHNGLALWNCFVLEMRESSRLGT
jgi:hypothetical protein